MASATILVSSRMRRRWALRAAWRSPSRRLAMWLLGLVRLDVYAGSRRATYRVTADADGWLVFREA